MENKHSDGRLLKIANILILATLLAITGLLASLHWKLSNELVSEPPAVTAPQPAAAPMPASQPPAAEPAASAPRRVPRAPAPPRNYTQAERESSPAIAAEPEETPAPVATSTAPQAPGVPTDVTPAPEPAEPEQPQWVEVTIPSGTIFTARLIDTLRSDQVRAGDRFRATLEAPIFADGMVAVPRGSTVEGSVVSAQQAGRVSGVAEISVELNRVLLSNGQTVELLTDSVTRQGETSKGEDVAKVGTGAAIGAIIGAIGGGGKGAAIGAATGAGAGTAGVLLTRGKPVILTPETPLSFQLRAPVSVQVLPGQAESEDYSYAPVERRPYNGDAGLPGRPRLRRRF
jgi:hypothetical protein